MGKLGFTMLSLAIRAVPVSIDHDGDVPVYVQLADILRARIASGELAPRRPVPSKRTLMQEYGVAGGTIDKAIGILRDEGLVRTVTGRGIYVIPPDQPPAR
jgi:GntR family transcriptional regulator